MKTSFRDSISVDIKRGGLVESQHKISAILMHPDGTLEECWGDPKMVVFPRSAVKPLQAMALVSSGAAEKFNLTSFESQFLTPSTCIASPPCDAQANAISWEVRLNFSAAPELTSAIA